VDDAEFIKLFGEFRKQEQLKSVPREYSAENENVELLKLKSFVAFHQLTDDELMQENSVTAVASVRSKIYPLNIFINNALS